MRLLYKLSMSSKNKPISINKSDLEKLYLDDELSTVEISKIYDCSARCIQNYLSKFGIAKRTMSEAIIISSAKRSEETLRNRAIKFSSTWYSRPKEERDEINKSRATKPEDRESVQQKRLKTILETSGGTKSKSEDRFYKKLLLYFDKEDIVRGYSDERYPFACDFYIKSKDLFIEYQGHYTHGYEPFDSCNLEHLSYLERMSKKVNMDTWVRRDPLKLLTAKQNKITLLLIYPRHNSYLIKNGEITASQINELW